MSTEPWKPEAKKYSSIDNTSKIKDSQIAKFADCDWIVCEKIHGANFGFITNGTEVVCSKRNGLLRPDEDFYNYQPVREKYREAVLRCWEIVRGRGLNEAAAALTIYGELFGGLYRHPSIAVDTGNGQPVQKEIKYCPHRDFLAFDMRCDNGDYFDMDVMWSVLEEAGVPYIKPLKTGCTFDEAIMFDPKFPTTVPALFGLPDIKGNFAEGVVIRPIKTLRMKNRVVFKIKYGVFGEQTPGIEKNIKEGDNSKVPANVVALQLQGFLNENRLVSVLSKEGELTEENRNKILGLLVDDAIEDYRKEEDFGKAFDALTKHEQANVKKLLWGTASRMFKDHVVKAE